MASDGGGLAGRYSVGHLSTITVSVFRLVLSVIGFLVSGILHRPVWGHLYPLSTALLDTLISVLFASYTLTSLLAKIDTYPALASFVALTRVVSVSSGIICTSVAGLRRS